MNMKDDNGYRGSRHFEHLQFVNFSFIPGICNFFIFYIFTDYYLQVIYMMTTKKDQTTDMKDDKDNGG